MAQCTVRPSALHEANSPPTSLSFFTGTGPPPMIETVGAAPPTVGTVMA